MKWLFESSFYKRLQISLFIFILVPLVLATIFSYVLIKDVVIQKDVNSNQSVVNIIADDLNKNIEDIIYATNLIGNPGGSTFEELKQFRNVTSLMSYQDYQRYNRISDDLHLAYSKTSGLNSKTFFVNPENLIIHGTKNIFETEAVEDFIDQNQLDSLDPNKLYWQYPVELETKQSLEKEAYYFAIKVISDSTSKNRIGAVYVGIPQTYFDSLFSETKEGKYLLYDSDEQLIVSYPQEESLFNDKYLEVGASVPMVDWDVVYQSSHANSTAEISQLFKYYAVFVAASILIFLVISIFISRSLYRPLNELETVAKDFGNENLDIRFPVTGDDEIATLGNAFNEMLDQIRGLITRVKEEQEKKRLIELEALFAQIRPHFLINTLNSIKYNLILDGDIEHSEKLNSLMRLLRANMKVDELTTLDQECKLLIDYNEIMQVRNDRLVHMTIDLPEALESFQVPRLILQPLVENAIVHGFEEDGVTEPSIHISVQDCDECVLIDIADNGEGMTRETLIAIRARLDENMKSSQQINPDGAHQSVGLKNVSQRLKMTYGTESGLEMFINEQGGVTVRIRITKIRQV